MKSIIIATLLVASVSAQAAPEYVRAKVVSVREIVEKVNRPTERCWMESAGRTGARDHGPGGAIAGAVVGGLLGNQIGGGSGRDIATGVGAVAGAVAGNNLASQHARPSHAEVRRCVLEDRWVREVTGYAVAYRHAGQVHRIVMQQRPGRTIDIKVRHGHGRGHH